MLKLSCLLLICILPAINVNATTYYCRDKEGQLHVTDNLQALPEECRGRAKVMEPENPDNLNFVPSQEPPPGSGREFQQEVREADQELQQKRGLVDSYTQRAQSLVNQYQQAVRDRGNATRRWTYGSRDIIQQADSTIRRVRADKQMLLSEMEGKNLPHKDIRRISSMLGSIEDE